MRVFISINPDRDTRKKLCEVQAEMKRKLDKRALDSIRWEAPEKMHITMMFIGDVKEAERNKLLENLSGIENKAGNMTFKSDEIGAFPNMRYPRVIFAKVEDITGNINELYHRIIRVTGYQSDKTFHPHITLGRVKRDRKVKLDMIKDIKFQTEFSSNRFYLMESTLGSRGSTYDVIDEFKI